MGKATPELEKENMYKILRSMKKYARKEVKDIAEETGLTRQTVSKLLNKMEEKKIIWGYAPIGDLDFFNMKHYTVFARVKSTVNKEKALAEYFGVQIKKLGSMDNVYILNSAILHGKYDVIIQFIAKDIINARKVFYHIFGNFIKHLEEYEIEESIVVTRKHGILNPNLLKMFKEYIAED